jgi:hypothetical protein
MKSYRNKVVWVMVFFTIFLFTSNAFALTWKICTVDNVGATSSAARVRLTATDKTFTQTWFDLEGPMVNQMLATILTAMSSGKKVWIQIDKWKNFSPIYGCYVID